MTAPIWMASPPEVHSALLSGGPGPGPLLAAAGAWSALSAEYAAAAGELTALLGAVQSGAWQGPTATRYLAAHLPYLAWLLRASADSAAMAAGQETAAAGYTAALAAMPTLAELAANHAVNAALVATNFFGVNTIPIAVNEADYVRMWIQAATVMGGYQAVAAAAVSTVAPVAAAPPIVEHDHDHTGQASPADRLVADILRDVTGGRVNWDPAHGTLNGLPYDSYTNPGQPLYWVVRALEFSQDFQTFTRELVSNPAAAFQFLANLVLFDWPTHIAQIASWLAQSPQLLTVALGMAVSNLGAITGFAGLTGLTAGSPAGIAVAAPPPPAHVWPAPGMAAGAGTTAVAAPPAGAPASAAGAAAGPAPATVPAGTGGFGWPYVIGGGPGVAAGSGRGASAGATAQRRAPAPEGAAALTAAAERVRARRRRRTAVTDRGHADEFMVLDGDVGVSEQGAGTAGFVGAVGGDPVAATGLTTLAGAGFGAGTRRPMLPETWRDTLGRPAGAGTGG